MRRAVAPIQPRLLTPEEAAAYLGYKSAAILAQVPVTPIRISTDGQGTNPRYDVRALDAWLDGLSGLMPVGHPDADPQDAAEAEFAAWRMKRSA
ncbi:hypothetical protein [Brevundimonas sp.]|uniref:hypothetical protein n=1 Tax=Brevundimonas sp. TaxID=1871086 RepID=UPI00257E940C|nr:hypothetical protein [Brevundimonas sp.]